MASNQKNVSNNSIYVMKYHAFISTAEPHEFLFSGMIKLSTTYFLHSVINGNDDSRTCSDAMTEQLLLY
jgi:hypothetical protein